MPADTECLIATVREEAARMLAATSTAGPEAMVSMPASQFQKLAEWMAQLCDQLDDLLQLDEGRLGDPRYWVPLANYQQLKANHTRLEQLYSFQSGGMFNLT